MRDASIACLRKIGVDTGGSNVQFAVNPADGRMVVIEMNPRVSRSSALASQGDRLPDRQDRGQARGRLHAGRAGQRHHPHHAGQLRADDRLRGGEDPALHLREIPRHAGAADHQHEVGRRGDGDRPQLRRGAAEGAAQHGDRAFRPRPGASRPAMAARDAFRAALSAPRPDRLLMAAQALRAGLSVEEIHDACQFDPWFLRELERDRRRRARGRSRRPAARTPTALRRLKALGFSDRAAGRSSPAAPRRRGRAARQRLGVHAGLQADRHLRRRVRLRHALHVLDLRGRLRRAGLRGAIRPTGRRSSSSAAGRTASARASSSTIAASMPPMRCARPGSRPSWSTATRRRSAPTTTPPTGCISSR